MPLRAEETAAPEPGAEQQDQEEGSRRGSGGVRFVFRQHPSLRIGRNFLRIDFRVKVQADQRSFYPYYLTDEGDFELHRVRVGIQGRFLRDFEFQVERELNNEISRAFRIQEETTPDLWQDVFVNYRHFRRAQLQVGRFKIPFSQEQLTGPSNLDFVNRAHLAKQLAPGRSQGVMLHGRFFERGLNYEAGVFRTDGDNAEVTEVIDEAGHETHRRTGVRTFAGRLTGAPLRLAPVPVVFKNVFKDVQIGVAFTSTSVPEGLYGLRGRTFSKETFFRHGFVRGERRRLGSEFRWTPGPFSLKSEFVHVQEERKQQGTRGEDLPNLVARGWYVSGSWILTGQKYDERDEPKKGFLFDRGLGAVELAARYDAIRFGSAEHPGRPSRSPRGANILSASDRAWTLGVNWYWNRFFKIQLNAVREKLDDAGRTPLPGEAVYWMRIVRVQFAL